ncbi:MAG: hypothetical protein JST84_24380 [Acidobacteria bacterium]|nr:hypothetical protein [Acidobacteriota bacterium]
MSHTPHTCEASLAPTKDFEVVLATGRVPRSFYTRQNREERAQAAKRTAMPESSLSAFHEEFRQLVLAEDDSTFDDVNAAIYIELFEPHELELCEIPEQGAVTRPSAVQVSTARPIQTIIQPIPTAKPTAPQQVVRPLAGPRAGTPMPLETWVVKLIAVLVGLNLLFAGLVVAGVRLSDLFK